MPKTYIQGLSSDFEQFFPVKNNLLTSVHNDTEDADATDAAYDADDTDDYNKVIGIAQLRAFCCAKMKCVSVSELNEMYCSVPVPWKELYKHTANFNRAHHQIRSDHFCFLESVQKSL